MPRLPLFKGRYGTGLESRKKFYGIPIYANVRNGKFVSITPVMKTGKRTRDYVVAQTNTVRFRRR